MSFSSQVLCGQFQHLVHRARKIFPIINNEIAVLYYYENILPKQNIPTTPNFIEKKICKNDMLNHDDNTKAVLFRLV